MGTTHQLTAADGHAFKAYRATPNGTPRGVIIVIQEIFGVNSHIRAVADGYAAAGYIAIAPQLFDRHAPDIELGYTPDDVAKGRDIRADVGFDDPVKDIAAAVASVQDLGLKTGVVGYCFGGALAWLSATRISGISAVSCYYGGAAAFKDEAPKCPVMLHYGEKDAMIPTADADTLTGLYPDTVQAFIYPADHGFNCDQRGSYDAPSAALALERSLTFFAKRIG